MKENDYTELTEPNFEEIFTVEADEGGISKIRAFNPELRGREIVLPVEFTKTDGTRHTLGFTLDREHLRMLFELYEFGDVLQ